MSALAPNSLAVAAHRPPRHAVNREDALRIALVSPPWFAVPPTAYGGIEAVVALLADELTDRGHDVTLFACAGSRTRARLVETFTEPPSDHIGETEFELRAALAVLRHLQRDRYDVVSDHSGPLGVICANHGPAPVVHTVHGTLEGDLGSLLAAAVACAPDVSLISLSGQQRAPQPQLPWAATIPNAIDLTLNAPRARAGGGYVAWIGRMSPVKGPEMAILAARRAGVPIKLAGKMRTAEERRFFDEVVRPLLGRDAEYLGEIRHDARLRLLHGARALLFPIAWDEPFGLVMTEALACGVPVVATRRGSVPEVIEHGVTGAIVDTIDEMAAAVATVSTISPAACRTAAERRFSPARMADDYVRAYRAAVRAGGRAAVA